MPAETYIPGVNVAEIIYKRWHRSGFVSIAYWASAGKVIIEVGATNEDKSLRSATKCYVGATQFLAYLRAEVHKNVQWIFPEYTTQGYKLYAGSPNKDGELIARVFSIKLWKDREGKPDLTAREIRCAHFDGKKNSQGAVEPIYTAKRSEDYMKLLMRDIAEIFEALNIKVLTDNVLHVLEIEDGVA